MKLELAELACLGQWVKVPAAEPDHLSWERTDSYKLWPYSLIHVCVVHEHVCPSHACLAHTLTYRTLSNRFEFCLDRSLCHDLPSAVLDSLLL